MVAEIIVPARGRRFAAPQEWYMSDSRVLIEQAYSAFNKRDIDGALALMTQDVSCLRLRREEEWSEKEEICAYWVRQWDEFDPHVEPLAMTLEGDGKVRVRVRQI